MRRLAIGALSLVLVFALTSVAIAASFDPGSGSTNFTVMNMDSSGDATVVASYINQNGVEDATKEKTIGPLSSDGFPISESGLPDGWIGSVIVSSDQEVSAFAQMLWAGGSYGDGKTAGAYNGFTAGANTLYFPDLAARDGAQFSRISIQSAESASTTETVDFTIYFYDRTGALSHTEPGTIYKGSQATYELLDLGLSDWLGAAVVESASPIAGVASSHWQQYSAAYSALTGGGTEAYMPSASRRLNSSGQWLQYTSIVVQNLDTGTDANVTVYWYDRDGTELYSFTDAIPANSSHGYNTKHTSSDVPNSSALHAALGNNWNGSVVVESDGPNIVAVVKAQWDASHPSSPNTASAYTSAPAGTAEVFTPAVFKRDGKQYSGLVVQNVGATTCTDFQVQWFERGTNALVLDYVDTLEPNIAGGYNTRVNVFPDGVSANDLGTDFYGSVYINAPSCELVAIHNTLWPAQLSATTYNSFGR